MRHVVSLAELGQAEVSHPYIAQGVEQKVGRLDVAVKHAAAVGILKSVGDLGANPCHLAVVAFLGGSDQQGRRRRSHRNRFSSRSDC